MTRAVSSWLLKRYRRLILVDYLPPLAIMCGGLWLTAVVIGI